MNKRVMKNVAISLTCFLLLFTVRVGAQIDPRQILGQEGYLNSITTAVPFLSIAPDSRAGAMGDIGCATSADANSQSYNPSKYVFNKNEFGFSVSYSPWLRQLVNDINLAYLAGYWRITDMDAIGASLRYFSLGEVELWDNFSESLSSGATADMTIKPYEMAFDAAYSRLLSDYFSMAVGMRFIFSDITFDYTAESSPGKAFAADIAMLYNNYVNIGKRECGLALGLNISNIGSKINYGGTENPEFIPTNLRLGLNLTIPFDEYNRFSISADANKLLVPTYPMQGSDESGEEFRTRVQKEYYDVSPIAGIFKSFHDAPHGFKEELQEIQWSVGAEYSYNDRFFLRLGYHDEHQYKGNRKYITAGAGFKMSIFSIDAAYVFSTAQTNPLDQTMRFTLGFDLDGIRDLFGRGR